MSANSAKPQTVLVTGGAGFIGSSVADLLLQLGHQVLIVDNLSTGVRGGLPRGAEFHQFSISDSERLSSLMKAKNVSAVLHLAAFIDVSESVKNPDMYYANNTEGTRNLLNAMIDAGVNQLIFSSTAAVYGQLKTVEVSEADTVDPINPYGKSKWLAEETIRDFTRKNPNFRHVIFRYFNVAGAVLEKDIGPRNPHPTQLIRRTCQAALGIIPQLQINGTDYSTADGTCIRDYIHIKDLAMTHAKGLEHLNRPAHEEERGMTFNVGYGRGFSILEVIHATEKILGTKVPCEIRPRREGDPMAVVANSQKAIRTLGLRWEHDSLEEICRDTLVWEKKLREALSQSRVTTP